MSITFLTAEEVRAIHLDQVRRYGGDPGVRDIGLFESAIAMPQMSFGGEYVHSTLAEMAAAYLFHLCKNHPFIDGNKRVALASALIFLQMNDHTLDADQDAVEQLTLSVAAGQLAKDQVAAFFREHVVERH